METAFTGDCPMDDTDINVRRWKVGLFSLPPAGSSVT
jgi:hypothetical protein